MRFTSGGQIDRLPCRIIDRSIGPSRVVAKLESPRAVKRDDRMAEGDRDRAIGRGAGRIAGQSDARYRQKPWVPDASAISTPSPLVSDLLLLDQAHFSCSPGQTLPAWPAATVRSARLECVESFNLATRSDFRC